MLLPLVTDRNVTELCDKMTTKTNHNRFVSLQKLSGPLCLIREEEEVAAHHLYCQQSLDYQAPNQADIGSTTDDFPGLSERPSDSGKCANNPGMTSWLLKIKNLWLFCFANIVQFFN